MKLFKILSFSLLIIFAVNTHLSAQKDHLAIADEAFNNNEFTEAVNLYKKAYTKVKTKEEKAKVHFQIAECYRKANRPEEAIKYYERILDKSPKNIVFLYYADMLKILQRYDEAIVQYKKYQEKEPSDMRGKIGEESCEAAKKWKDTPTRYNVIEMKAFNSKFSDFSTFFTDQKKFNALVFTSGRETSSGKETDAWTGQSFTDIYETRRDRKGDWSSPSILGKTINTESNEGATCINRKGNELYFTRCPREKKKRVNCKIYVAQYAGNEWGEAKELPLVPDTITVGHPFISDDELELYFSSDLPNGSQGGKDIFVVKRNSKSEAFGAPVNLGPTINTAYDDMFPYIRKNEELYFSSYGHIGMGGLDIFKSVKQSDGKWGRPVNMLAPINSNADDYGIVFYGDEERGLFTSNRNLKTNDDIYYFWLPSLLYTLSGTIRDDSTKNALSGVIVKVTDSDGKIFEGKTGADGTYKFDTTQILPKKTYNLVFSKEPLYFNAKGQITTVGLEQSKDLVLDKNLRPIPKKPIVLPDILYDLAKWDLKPQYQDSLNDLFETMMDNPKIVIELASHTDTRAKDEYNDTLSQKRAQSVVNYLIQKGIDTERMIAKGYGEKVPRELKEGKTVVFNNKKYTFKKGTVITDAFISKLKSNDEKEAAHQLNRRTEFRIIRQDYIPKPKSEGNIQTPVTPVIKEEAKPIDATKDIKPAEPIKDDKTGKKDATKQQKQAPEKKGSVGKKK